MTAVLVHGIRSFDPLDSMGGLHDRLPGSLVVDYGYILVPLNNHRGKKFLKRMAHPGCTLVGYSNGGAVCHAAAEAVQARHVVLISPALRRDVKWPDCVESVTVFYSNGDRVVRVGGAWATAANCMPWRWGSSRDHPWGRLGVYGPNQDDPIMRGIDMGAGVRHSWFNHPSIVDTIAVHINALEGGL